MYEVFETQKIAVGAVVHSMQIKISYNKTDDTK